MAETGSETIRDVQETNCCIVGGGPAGVILGLLLGRAGVPVTLLESHLDFDRDFRGDTVHPSTLEILDQIGLADGLLQTPHGKLRTLTFHTAEGPIQVVDLSLAATRFPYVAVMPQARFLEFIAAEAKKYPRFRLVMGANVQRLVQENGIVRGVQYHDTSNEWHEVRAPLTVAADGRFSRVRHLLGLKPVQNGAPMDVLWFRLPRQPDDARDALEFFAGAGALMFFLDRGEEWQIGYVIAKGGYQKLRAAGLDELRRNLTDTVPWLKDRVDRLQDWQQVTLLAVESSRLETWYQPGVLLIGDAAHTMSPVGGVGINYAIQDAVEVANLLSERLKAGTVSVDDLADVQRVLQWPVSVMQAIQAQIQQRLVVPALERGKPFRLPLVMRLMARVPLLRRIPARIIAFGPRRVRLKV
jgi:2-polyprenyl-6-methoxyphenol hydroxylase-like FAD-dependent oxidoreductase